MAEGKRKGQMRGRVVDPAALAAIRALLGELPRRRDLLIEYLHRMQDHFGHLSNAHLVALADELKLAMTEVYEVATFYHHFDVVPEGTPPPPPITVRVCDSITCEMFGAQALHAELVRTVGTQARVQRVPCVGRCHAAPVAVVGQSPIEHATPATVLSAVVNKRIQPASPAHLSLEAYRQQGGYRTLIACDSNDRDREKVIKSLQDSKLRGLGGAGFPAGNKWSILREQAEPRLMSVNND